MLVDVEVAVEAVCMEVDPPDPDWLGRDEQDWSRLLEIKMNKMLV